MKLLLVGNHTCGNRGDAAILRGLIAELRKQEPTIELDIISRFPVSSSFLLGEKVTMDQLHAYHGSANGFVDRLWKRVSQRFQSYQLVNKLSKPVSALPEHIQQQVAQLQQYDAVIQVGGSFFVDLYGPAQFEHAICALFAKKPLFMLGHSVGPFESERYKKLASKVFSKVNTLALRESVSLQLMEEANIDTSKASEGADTAWVVPNKAVAIPEALSQLVASKPTIAMTMRKLAPFDKRLGVTQEEYEIKLAQLIDSLNDKGYQVLITSTCTGIDSYQRDDRMVALTVKEKVKNQELCHVVMDELNDVELGSLLSLCELTIGTRLHSAIISMNFSTPAIALNYEHKSKGIMQQLDLPEMSMDVSSLFDGTLQSAVFNNLNNLATLKENMTVKVTQERGRVTKMVENTLRQIKEQA
ncbi:colanic acid biosynthesis pyruvyl transferase WcaK [Pseudoalteromonas byunsanensis]|uniref:Colanic acid biosynthesis pyruvyl transferase WcaK n=1 Tax=Pseudoalteromonas byunsanensis TaxID=327939 RepID=A0A1S1N9B0_9GAMM|nr:colanic acid biosynthesis pyruvyl transferase WcaK [Pseudoalteromonas byunsanensis]OHU95285.1 colanic acid biosynthesis pyruvyl transferase WcaK [Pseudoalteromonas byunsanensis]